VITGHYKNGALKAGCIAFQCRL